MPSRYCHTASACLLHFKSNTASLFLFLLGPINISIRNSTKSIIIVSNQDLPFFVSYATRKIMRNVSKNKFLRCFRAVVDIDAMLDSKVAIDRSPSCRFACFPFAGKHEMKHSEAKSLLFHQGSPSFTEDWIMHQPPKRTLSRVIKAVVFETISNRRARYKNRYGQDSFGSKRSCSTYTESSSTGDEKSISSLASVDSNTEETKALESSLSSSSSCGSASSSSSPTVSESKNLSKYCSTKEKHRDPLEKQKKFERNGLYLVLLSLAITVVWGKLLGIILTSTWLCFFFLWGSCHRLRKEVAKLPKTDQSLQE